MPRPPAAMRSPRAAATADAEKSGLGGLLRKYACITTPADARPAPTAMPTSTRG